MRRFLPLLAAAFLCCLSCVRPRVSDQFVRASDAADGIYRFELDLSDSLCTWDVSFYTRLEGPAKLLSEYDALPLDIEWLSPSGTLYGEQVMMSVPSGRGRVRDALRLYRSNLALTEPGAWKLALRCPCDAPLRGFGVISKRNDGTR